MAVKMCGPMSRTVPWICRLTRSQRESKPHLVSRQVPQESRRELRLQILECARHVSIARRFAGENLGAILLARCRPVKAVVSGGMHLVLGG